jgi:hypothetical protein
MNIPFECVNCGRIYAADKLPKCPVCSASGPMMPEKSNVHQSTSSANKSYLDYEEPAKGKELVVAWGSLILWYGGIAFLIFIVLGIITDGYGSGSGTVPGKECYAYEQPDGDWADSCDL